MQVRYGCECSTASLGIVRDKKVENRSRLLSIIWKIRRCHDHANLFNFFYKMDTFALQIIVMVSKIEMVHITKKALLESIPPIQDL